MPRAKSVVSQIVGNGCTECCVLPSGSTSLGAITPAVGCATPVARSAARAPGRTSMSWLAGTSHGALLRSATRFTAAPKPRFPSDSISDTHGNSLRTISAEPSDEALSTTQTSTPAALGVRLERAKGPGEQVAEVPRHDRDGDLRPVRARPLSSTGGHRLHLILAPCGSSPSGTCIRRTISVGTS